MKTTGKVLWASVPKIDKKYSQWSVKLEVSKAEAKKLEDVGLKVTKEVIEDPATGEDRVVLTRRFSRNLMNKSTNEKNDAPTVVDAGKNPFSGDKVGIGIGSEVIVLHRPYKWGKEGGEFGQGVNADLKAVQVIKLVPYEFTSSGEDDLDDGDDEFEVLGEGLVDSDEQFTDETKGEDIPY